MRTKFLSALSACAMVILGAPVASAQFGDLSPVLIVESGPSDNPDYRRMVYVKFLSGDRVSVNYKAYNRAEFIQVPDDTAVETIRACSNGAASSLTDLQAFERTEAKLKRQKKTPEITRFCIKNVQNWEGGNRSTYLDPIFNGLPYAANLN